MRTPARMSYTLMIACYQLVGSEWRSCCLSGFQMQYKHFFWGVGVQNLGKPAYIILARSLIEYSLLYKICKCRIFLVYLYRAINDNHLIKQKKFCIPQTYQQIHEIYMGVFTAPVWCPKERNLCIQ